MTPERSLDDAVKARARNPREAETVKLDQAREQRTTAQEKRSIMATVRAIAKPILAAFGVRLP